MRFNTSMKILSSNPSWDLFFIFLQWSIDMKILIQIEFLVPVQIYGFNIMQCVQWIWISKYFTIPKNMSKRSFGIGEKWWFVSYGDIEIPDIINSRSRKECMPIESGIRYTVWNERGKWAFERINQSVYIIVTESVYSFKPQMTFKTIQNISQFCFCKIEGLLMMAQRIRQIKESKVRERACIMYTVYSQRNRNGYDKMIFIIFFSSAFDAAGCHSVETFQPFVNYVTVNYFTGQCPVDTVSVWSIITWTKNSNEFRLWKTKIDWLQIKNEYIGRMLAIVLPFICLNVLLLLCVLSTASPAYSLSTFLSLVTTRCVNEELELNGKWIIERALFNNN